MDERQHTAFTGVRATVDSWVGGRHSAWDGDIEGQFVELDTGRRILMTWRSTRFPLDAPDSHVEVQLDPVAGGTRVTIHHTVIPEGQSDEYKKGWRTHYLEPMKRYFSKPGAMRAAMEAASQAGKLPIPGVTRARPGVRHASAPEDTRADVAESTTPRGGESSVGRKTTKRRGSAALSSASQRKTRPAKSSARKSGTAASDKKSTARKGTKQARRAPKDARPKAPARTRRAKKTAGKTKSVARRKAK